MQGSFNREPQRRFWKGIWELRVPHKIKHFVWRACHNVLPTKCNLVRWNIINLEVCELCNEGQEDVLHALWQRWVVESVWSCHSWAQQAVNPPPLTFCDLFDRFLQVTDDFRKEIFAVAAWCLWRPPEHDHFKVNFDAAVFKSFNLADIGVVIRDWRGDVVAALSMPTALASTVTDLEALACCHAVMFAADKDLQNVIFEGDSVSVTNAIVQEDPVLTSYGDTVDDIHSLVSVF